MHHRPDGAYFWTTFLLLSAAAITGGQHIAREFYVPKTVPESLFSLFQHHMTMTRILLGVCMIMVAPLLLNLTLRVLAVAPRCTGPRILLIGLMPAAMAFSLSWLPPPVLAVACVAPAILAWILIHKGLTLSNGQTAAVWSLYGLALLLTSATGLYALESAQARQPLNPLAELASMRQVAQQAHENRQIFSINSGTHSPSFAWNTSGSTWLDVRGNFVQIEIQGRHTLDREVSLVETTTGKAVALGTISDEQWRSGLFLPNPNATYQINVPDGFATDDIVTVLSFLPANTNAE